MPDLAMSVPSWRHAASRFVVVLSGLALLLTSLSIAAPVDAATELGQRINATRNGQSAAETAMRRADREVLRSKAQKKASKKGLKKAKKKLRKTGKRRARASRRADNAREAYLAAKAARKKASEAGTKHTVSKLKVTRLRKEMRRSRSSWRVLHKKYGRLVSFRWQQRQAMRAATSKLRGAVGRREGAEAVLRGHIASMTALARARVANMIGTSLARDTSNFTWPTTGRISGGYGCTTAKFYPRRGSCAHFHDGIDIANVPGTPIRSVADGVVAFVGWNPSDVRGRAFIIVVVHPGGLVSRYGHMLPGRRVKAGQLVRQGEVIARMGSTGFSTGSHLHVEILAGSTPVNPAIYLPAYGTPPPKIDDSSKKKAKAQAKKKAKAKGRKARGKQARKRKDAQAARSAAARRAERDAHADQCALDGSSATSIGDTEDEYTFTATRLTARIDVPLAGVEQPFAVELDEEPVCETTSSSTADKARVDVSVPVGPEHDGSSSKSAAATPARTGPTAPVRSTSPTPQ